MLRRQARCSGQSHHHTCFIDRAHKRLEPVPAIQGAARPPAAGADPYCPAEQPRSAGDEFSCAEMTALAGEASAPNSKTPDTAVEDGSGRPPRPAHSRAHTRTRGGGRKSSRWHDGCPLYRPRSGSLAMPAPDRVTHRGRVSERAENRRSHGSCRHGERSGARGIAHAAGSRSKRHSKRADEL